VHAVEPRGQVASKAQGSAFLAALGFPWPALLAPARLACQAAAVAAAAATEAAAAVAAAAVADHQPPAAPSVVAAGAVAAAAVDVASMSSTEKRALLAKLGGFMDDEWGTLAREPPKSHVTCACFLSLVGGLVRL